MQTDIGRKISELSCPRNLARCFSILSDLFTDKFILSDQSCKIWYILSSNDGRYEDHEAADTYTLVLAQIKRE